MAIAVTPIVVQAKELHRLSIDEYHQLVESGGLDEDTRIELIDGLLVDMSPKTPRHENAISWLNEWLIAHLDLGRYQVRVTGPLTLGTSEPEPDISVIDRPAPTGEHPNHARLVIEVAVSSKARDLVIKPRIYAAAVDECWVVDLEQRRIVVHRDPGPDGYKDITQIPGRRATTGPRDRTRHPAHGRPVRRRPSPAVAPIPIQSSRAAYS